MKRLASALALVASLSLAVTPVLAAPPYTSNTNGTTLNGVLEALTDIQTNTAAGGGVAQASTTSGQTGMLTQCAATTAAPTLLTGKTYPCSLNLSGGLRVDGSGVTQPVSLTSLPAFAAIPAVKIDQTTNKSTNNVTVDGVQDGTQITGSATSAAALSGMSSIDVTGFTYATLQFTSAGSGNQWTPTQSEDGSLFVGNNSVTTQASGGVATQAAQSVNTASAFVIPITSKYLKVAVTSYGSGTVTATLTLHKGALPTMLFTVVSVAPSGGVMPVAGLPSSSSTYSLTPAVTSGAASSLVVKASAGNLYEATATNTSGAQAFLLVFNATSAPADGTVTPQQCIVVANNDSVTWNAATASIAERYTTGITLVLSSTGCFTKTAVTGFLRAKYQ